MVSEIKEVEETSAVSSDHFKYEDNNEKRSYSAEERKQERNNDYVKETA